MKTFTIVGVPFHACTHDSAVVEMERWVSEGQRSHYVCVSNVFDVRLAQQQPAVRQALLDADLVVPDGMPIVWGGRLLGHHVPSRVDGPTLMWRTLGATVKEGRSHFLYGGNRELLDTLSDRLRQAFPGIKIVGTLAHPFRDLTPDEERSTIDVVNGSGADYLWVGIGTERQLLWMHRYRNVLRVPVIVGVGAAFAFHAGLSRRAPRWMRERGLEWLFRLASEPRRLWYRYLVVNPPILLHLAAQCLEVRMLGRR